MGVGRTEVPDKDCNSARNEDTVPVDGIARFWLMLVRVDPVKLQRMPPAALFQPPVGGNVGIRIEGRTDNDRPIPPLTGKLGENCQQRVHGLGIEQGIIIQPEVVVRVCCLGRLKSTPHSSIPE
jgi:hypothetical protein